MDTKFTTADQLFFQWTALSIFCILQSKKVADRQLKESSPSDAFTAALDGLYEALDTYLQFKMGDK